MNPSRGDISPVIRLLSDDAAVLRCLGLTHASIPRENDRRTRGRTRVLSAIRTRSALFVHECANWPGGEQRATDVRR